MILKRPNEAAIRKLQREFTEVRRCGRGAYIVRLRIDHQSFQLHAGGDPYYESRKRAYWTARQLAIALDRLMRSHELP